MRVAVRWGLMGGLTGLLVALGLGAVGEAADQKNPPLVIQSVHGRDLFEFYCASCHGPAGKGNGPVASALTTKPADLTTIAARNQGTFPSRKVESFIAGDTEVPQPAHGTRVMPVWGPIFRSLDPNDTRTKVRIANLVAYIQSIQSK
jgi:mono/diheme cytochrome c family protein